MMHDRNLMHRDIKGENILFGSGGKVKICDFGFSRRLTEEEQRKSQVGSYVNTAPEVLLGLAQTVKVDIFSLGNLAYELTLRQVNYQNIYVLADEGKQVAGIPDEWTPEFKSFTLNCIARDPENRLNIN